MVTPRGPRAASLAAVSTERARLARLQADAIEIKNARQRGALLDAEAVKRSGRPSWRRCALACSPCRRGYAARLPHLSKSDVAEIDQEVRAALAEVGEA